MRFFTTALAVFVLIATTANGSPMLRMETKGKKGKSKTEDLSETQTPHKLVEYTSSYSNLDPISQEMLRAGKDGVILAVERSIAAEIPARFSIMLNGWTHASERCIAVFACYEVNGCLKTPQLTMAPLFDAQDDVLSEQGHLELCYRRL
ncbi:uncharacterized protein IUM83_18126 [Phytophthora cinnamomi]|uniref:uncharacterized protein n=1 Tax=Phytophthora cinnamomi TaxID=4785 RepID=UPI00355A26F7|nr:hypothetical protein IUM83_18126 [Phytophthora cinnamomi]